MLREDRGIQFDVSRWPVAVVRPHRGLTDAELDDFLWDLRMWIRDRRELYALVWDLRRFAELSPGQRQRIRAEVEDPEVAVLCRGTAMVFGSRALQVLLRAFLWINRPAQPVAVFHEYRHALEWAFGQAAPTDARRAVG